MITYSSIKDKKWLSICKFHAFLSSALSKKCGFCKFYELINLDSYLRCVEIGQSEELDKIFVAFCSFFPCSLTVVHRGRQQKSGGRQ